DEAEEIAWDIQRSETFTFIHAFSDPDIIAGQGTIALEILDELADVGTIVVPIGGGGLIAGIAVAAKGLNSHLRVIGVQSVASPAMYNSLQAGVCVETPIDETIADGLAGRFVTELTLSLAQAYVDEVVLVSEAAIQEAMRFILATEHMILEGSAAVGVAALLESKFKSQGKVVIVLTGRNIHSKILKFLLT
ncbi:MAG: threonine/serine dehydratase, partial [bacterium]